MKERNEEEYEFGVISFRTAMDLFMKDCIKSLLDFGIIDEEEIKWAIKNNSAVELLDKMEKRIIIIHARRLL